MKIDEAIGPNSHLLIIWSSAKQASSRIEKHLSTHFTLRHRFSIQWSSEHFERNMSRFYGQKIPVITKKINHCGTNAFDVLIFDDPSPHWAIVETTSGPQRVNNNVFEAKKLYREMSGGGHKVHATNNQSETLRDTALLFGSELPQVSETQTLNRDLAGAECWNSLSEFFSVLNFCGTYVVLRNFDSLPSYHDTDLHGDIDILCHNGPEFAALANAERIFPQKYRRYYKITVKETKIPVDIRDTTERYYCMKWSTDILNRRIKENGLYIPSTKDYLFSITYHALAHKKKIAPDYCKKILQIFSEKDQTDPNSSNMGYPIEALRSFMFQNNYQVVRPRDWSVFFNYQAFPETPFPKWRLLTSPPRTRFHARRELREVISTSTFRRLLRPLYRFYRRLRQQP